MNSIKDWTDPKKNEDGTEYIDVPDELMTLFNQVGFQLRLHTITGKEEVKTVASIIYLAQRFFICQNQNQPVEAIAKEPEESLERKPS